MATAICVRSSRQRRRRGPTPGQLVFDFTAVVLVVVARLPHEATCRCGAPTLVVSLSGLDVALDRAEVLEPYPCSLCAQVEAKGHTRGACWRCHGTKTIGEALPAHGVAIDEDGVARWFEGEMERPQAGDAIHVRHVCAAVALAA